jgi:hypothetical protein
VCLPEKALSEKDEIFVAFVLVVVVLALSAGNSVPPLSSRDLKLQGLREGWCLIRSFPIIHETRVIYLDYGRVDNARAILYVYEEYLALGERCESLDNSSRRCRAAEQRQRENITRRTRISGVWAIQGIHSGKGVVDAE